MSTPLKTLAIAVVAMTASGNALANTVEKMSFTEVVKDARIGVIGEVVDSSVITEDGVVKTLTVFEVQETAFGDAPSRVTVETFGGRLSGTLVPMAEVSSEELQFFAGQRNLLFLDQAGGGNNYQIVGTTQGAFSIARTRGGDKVMLPESAGGAVDVANALSIAKSRRAGPERDVQ